MNYFYYRRDKLLSESKIIKIRSKEYNKKNIWLQILQISDNIAFLFENFIPRYKRWNKDTILKFNRILNFYLKHLFYKNKTTNNLRKIILKNLKNWFSNLKTKNISSKINNSLYSKNKIKKTFLWIFFNFIKNNPITALLSQVRDQNLNYNWLMKNYVDVSQIKFLNWWYISYQKIYHFWLNSYKKISYDNFIFSEVLFFNNIYKVLNIHTKILKSNNKYFTGYTKSQQFKKNFLKWA